MAEHVQASLEAMVAPLLDLQDREVFSPDEVRAILKRRRESEYRLRRRSARKSDFVAYLQAEARLERLREIRTRRQKEMMQRQQRRPANSEQEDRTILQRQQTKRAGDKHVVQHLLLLWTRTMQKFRGDEGLWLHYIEFLKSYRRHGRLSAAYAEALRYHPRAAGLWAEAAGWELFDQSSPGSARILLQRGLRLNPRSRELWLHSFQLEMHVVQKLAGRRKVLELSDGGEGGGEEEPDREDEGKGESAKGDPYSLARLVLDHAAKALSKSENDLLDLYLECLQSCRSFPRTLPLQRHLLGLVRRHGPNAAASWMAQASWLRNNPGAAGDGGDDDSAAEPDAKRSRLGESAAPSEPQAALRDPVLKLLRRATQSLPAEDMYREATRFLSRYLREKDEGTGEGGDEEPSTPDSDEGRKLLDTLWSEARSSDFFSSALVLEYADYLVDTAADQGDEGEGAAEEAAAEVLQDFVEKAPGGGARLPAASAAVWTRLAQLRSGGRDVPSDESVATLRRGLEQTPPYQPDHMSLLLQLFGALLARSAGKSQAELWLLLDRILLLYPGFVSKVEDLRDAPFGVSSVPEACLEFQQRVAGEEGLDGSRRLCDKLLFQSGLVEALGRSPDAARYVEDLVDQAVAAESRCAIPSVRRKNLLRILDLAVRRAPSAGSKERYRAARDDLQFSPLSRTLPSPLSKGTLPLRIPSFDASSSNFSPELIRQAYDVYQIVHVRNVPAGLPAKGRLSWRDLGPVFQDLDPEDQKSWCVETHGSDGAGGDIDPAAFLGGTESSDRAYCSFLVQHDRISLDRLAARLPAPGLGWEDEAAHEPAIWIFFGRNPAGSPGLDGRPEHTDSVSHDGTWHYQLSGRKEWSLRPSSGLLRHLGQILPSRATAEWTEELYLGATCSERDVLAVNTRLWFHRTRIPAQRGPSVSLARDFRFASGDEEDVMDGGRAGPGGMSNLDGLYARADIEEGTVVFTELEMPDAELHVSSTDPNCRVVTLEDGSSAVVSTRLIRAGEFFCVPESPSDDDVEDDEEPDDDGAEKEEDEADGYAGDGSDAD